jgi:hypothetical protein
MNTIQIIERVAQAFLAASVTGVSLLALQIAMVAT